MDFLADSRCSAKLAGLLTVLLSMLAPLGLSAERQSIETPAAQARNGQSVSQTIAGLTRMEGFVPLYWDPHQGKLFMEISRLDEDFLYLVAAPERPSPAEVQESLSRAAREAQAASASSMSPPSVLPSHYRLRPWDPGSRRVPSCPSRSPRRREMPQPSETFSRDPSRGPA